MIGRFLALVPLALLLTASPQDGQWVKGTNGEDLGDYQISGLTWVDDGDTGGQALWAITDQNCTECAEGTGRMLRIGVGDAQLTHPPVPIARSDIRNPDFECLAELPDGGAKLRKFIAVTEDEETPQVVTIKVTHNETGGYSAVVEDAVKIEGIEHYPGSKSEGSPDNSRIEGCAVGDDGVSLYLAFERDDEERPLLFKTAVGAPRLDEDSLVLDWTSLSGAVTEDSNFNGLALARGGLLLILMRNQERVIFWDLGQDKGQAREVVDLNLDARPKPERFSPEGIATDGKRIWIINDPWKGKYLDYLDTRDSTGKGFTSLLWVRPLGGAARVDAPSAERKRGPGAHRVTEPPRPPEPLPPAQKAVETELLGRVRDWAAAWSQQDIEAYLSFYAAGFRPAGPADRATWERRRRERFGEPRCIVQVEVSEPIVERAGDGRYRVRFLQAYRSDRFSDTGNKVLTFVGERNVWRIQNEEFNLRSKDANLECP